MTASELIDALQSLLSDTGDLPVLITGDYESPSVVFWGEDDNGEAAIVIA